MHSFTTFLLCITISFTILNAANGSAFLYNICSNSENYTAGDAYANNLKQVEYMLTVKAKPTGFAIASAGQNNNKVNGLALCRGDVNSSACSSCIRSAAQQLNQLCSRNKEAIIWFDDCLLRYSDIEFFGKIDYTNIVYMWNTQNVSNPAVFNNEVKKLLNGLNIKAYHAPLLLASEEMEIDGGTQKLYGLVQCTRDLSSEDCKKCLDFEIGRLPDCCDGKRGGRVLSGSCNFRYELYPFYDI